MESRGAEKTPTGHACFRGKRLDCPLPSDKSLELLTRRVLQLEDKQSEIDKCDHEEAYARLFEIRRTVWKTRVLQKLTNPLRKLPMTRKYQLGNAFRPHFVRFDKEMAFEMFSHFANNAATPATEDVSFYR